MNMKFPQPATAGDLATFLKQFPASLPVLVEGYRLASPSVVVVDGAKVLSFNAEPGKAE